jgi:hypothetical protein
MFSLTTVYEKQNDAEATIRHLRNYLAKFGDKGGAGRVVIAYSKIGALLMKQSCPVPLIDGSCVKITRERALASKKIVKKKGKEVYVAPKQCGPESKIKLNVVKRDDRKVRDAMAAFGAAAKAFGNVNAQDESAAGAKYYYAAAKIAEADLDFEKYLDLKFPTGLNFGDGLPENKAKNEELAKKSMARFKTWIEQKTKLGEDVNRKYEAVLAVKDNANSIVATARLGQVTQNFSDQLFTAEIPEEVRRPLIIDGYDVAQDKVDAYCDALTTVAEPLAAKSLVAYGVCLSKSTELGWFSEWSKMCERELGQIKPEEFPTSHELRGEPTRVAPVTDVEPAIGKLE